MHPEAMCRRLPSKQLRVRFTLGRNHFKCWVGSSCAGVETKQWPQVRAALHSLLMIEFWLWQCPWIHLYRYGQRQCSARPKRRFQNAPSDTWMKLARLGLILFDYFDWTGRTSWNGGDAANNTDINRCKDYRAIRISWESSEWMQNIEEPF